MSTPESVLKKLSVSLESTSKKKVPHVDYAAFKVKVDALKQLDPSLVTLFRLCDAILVYVDKEQRNPELLKGVAADMKTLTTGLSLNLKKIDSVQTGLQQRISRFDLLEAKYTRMVTRVNGVLDELERVLRQM